MRLIINTSTIKVGGAVQVALNIIMSSRDVMEWDIFFITNKELYALAKTDSEKTLVLSHSPAKPTAFKERSLIKEFARNINPDVIYSVGAPSYIFFKHLEVLRLTNPWIINKFSKLYKLYPLSERIAMRAKVIVQRLFLYKSKYFITQTEDAKQKIISNLKKESENVYVIENVFSYTFRSYVDLHFTRDYQKDINVLIVSAPYPHKNLNLAIDIASLLKAKEVKNIYFTVTYPAEDFLTSDFYKKIKEKGVENYFRNLGKVNLEQLPEIYKSAHILFLPTLLEIFSVTLLEAMIFEIPILTTKFSFNETVCEDAAIYLDNPYDAEEAMSKIFMLIDSPAKRKELVESGKKKVSRINFKENIYERHFDVIKEISQRNSLNQ